MSVLDQDINCEHKDRFIEAPCCDGRECGCMGEYSVYCYDCRNHDLSDDEANEIILDYLYGKFDADFEYRLAKERI